MVAAAAGRLAGSGPIQISWLTSPASQFITAEQSQSIINRLPVVASDDFAENFTVIGFETVYCWITPIYMVCIEYINLPHIRWIKKPGTLQDSRYSIRGMWQRLSYSVSSQPRVNLWQIMLFVCLGLVKYSANFQAGNHCFWGAAPWRPTPFTTPRRLWRMPRRCHTHIVRRCKLEFYILVQHIHTLFAAHSWA